MTHALSGFLDAFVARLRAELAGVQVVDGPPVEYARREIVAVGITTEDASVEANTADAGLRARRESIDVINLIRSASGDVDLVPHRRRAYELLDQFDGLLRTDPTVGGVVPRARLISHVYTPVRTQDGVAVYLEPRVRVDAFPS